MCTLIDKNNYRAWQSCIGYVPQQIFLADDTVAANIAFGLENKDIELVKTEGLTSDERKKNKFVKNLFKKLDTNELNIDNLQLNVDTEDIDGDGVEERIIIIRQKEIIKQ